MDEEAHRKHVPLQVFIDHLRALLEVVSNTICKSDSAFNLRNNAKHALNPRELYCSKLILNNCITKMEGVNNHCKKTRLQMKNFTFFLFDSDFPLMNINTSQVTKSVNY